MNDFENNIQLELKLDRTLKAILGNQFIKKDPIWDKQEGTDFAIMIVNPFKVGVRLRRYKFWLKPEYREQFTIRWSLSSGNKTEIDKIRDGFVNYILYGFVDDCEKRIIQYFIGDLLIFRLHEPTPLHIYSNQNKDDSKLAVYKLKDLPKDFIIKKWRTTSEQRQGQMALFEKEKPNNAQR